MGARLTRAKSLGFWKGVQPMAMKGSKARKQMDVFFKHCGLDMSDVTII